jgi:ribosomal protection tetracycline resistance protein
VVDCVVTLTHTGYASPVTVAGDFRGLTRLVLLAALERAGTEVHEPLDRVEIELPADALHPVLAAITRSGGLPAEPTVHGETCAVEAVVPVARLRDLARVLPGLTGGAGLLTARFAGYRRISGPRQANAGVDTPMPPRVVAP